MEIGLSAEAAGGPPATGDLYCSTAPVVRDRRASCWLIREPRANCSHHGHVMKETGG